MLVRIKNNAIFVFYNILFNKNNKYKNIMKRLKNIIIVFFLISNCYYFGNPFENCFLCSYFFGERNVIMQNDESCVLKSKKSKVNSFNKKVSENRNFSINGLDIYWLDDFSEDSLTKYQQIIYDKCRNKNIGEFRKNQDNIIKTKEGAWIWHLYKKKEDEGSNATLITSIAKFMSTTGGNSFDWYNFKDKTQKSSEGRHNKNVIIIKLKDKNSILFKNTIFTFRQFVNMSYCPVPIIFTGDFDYNGFEKDLESFNSDFTQKNNKGNIEISVGDVDFNEPIDGKTCFYVKQDEEFVDKVVENLELAAAFHNTKGENTDYDTFNIAIVGAKRAGKSTLTTRLLNKFCGKTGNDKCSVSNKIGKYTHFKGASIPISVIDVPGFERGKDYDAKLKDWIVENEGDEKTKVHAIVYLINANNLPKPKNFGEPLKDITTEKKITNGEFFSKQEKEVFKFLKEKKIPVVFCITRSESVENGYKYLRKFFGDLTLISEISNYDSNEENWKAEDQWICNKWTRGTLLQLKDDNEKGLFGLVRLLTCFQDLYENNDDYKQRLHESFKDNDQLNDKFNNLFTALKEEIKKKKYKKIWKEKNKDEEINRNDYISFVDDDITGPLRGKNRKDIIFEIFENPLIKSLEQLHDNSWCVTKCLDLSKEILNLVCQYDYFVPNNKIAQEVTKKIKDKHSWLNIVSGVANTFSKFASFFKDNNDDLSDCIENIITMSLPNKENLKDL